VKGSFTDAKTDRVAPFELAEAGTLFLDEIGTVSARLAVEAASLVLQTGDVERVGSSKARHVDVRVISSRRTPNRSSQDRPRRPARFCVPLTRSDHSHVDVPRLGRADALDVARLQHAKQLRLQASETVPISSRNSVSGVGELEPADPVRLASVNEPFT